MAGLGTCFAAIPSTGAAPQPRGCRDPAGAQGKTLLRKARPAFSESTPLGAPGAGSFRLRAAPPPSPGAAARHRQLSAAPRRSRARLLPFPSAASDQLPATPGRRHGKVPGQTPRGSCGREPPPRGKLLLPSKPQASPGVASDPLRPLQPALRRGSPRLKFLSPGGIGLWQG